MNTINVLARNNKNNISNNVGEPFLNVKKGDVLVGLIKDVNDNNVSINIASINKEINMDKNSFNFDIKKGMEVNFKVNGTSSEKLELSLLGNETIDEKALSSLEKGLTSKDVFESYDFIESEGSNEVNEASEDEEDESLKIASENLYDETIKKILKNENFDVFKMSINELVNIIVASNKKELEGVSDNSIPFDLKSLPDEMKKEIQTTIEKVDNIKNANEDELDQIAIKIVKDQKMITLNNLVEAKYKTTNVDYNSSFDVNTFENDIKTILENEKIEVTDENVKNAKLLIKNDVDVTKDNIEKINSIKTVIKEINSNSVLKDKIASSIYNAKDVCLDSSIEEKVKDIDETLSFALEDKNLHKLANLDIKKLNIKQIKEFENNLISNNEKNEVNIDTENDLKVMLNETRLMLSSKSAYVMYSKGIDLEIEPLKNVVKELKNISDITTNVDNAMKLNEVNEELTSLNNHNMLIFKDEVKNIKHSIKDYSNLNLEFNNSNDIKISNRMTSDEIDKLYGSNMIESRYTLNGEHSIAKRNMSEILNMLGIEDNEINKKCGLVLSLSNNEVSEENINKIKIAEEKVDFVLKSLTPKVTLSLIEDGIDITSLDIDDAITEINKKLEIVNAVKENKKEVVDNINNSDELYNSLADMITSKTITDEVKDAMLGIYRIINKINKYSNAGLGILDYESDEDTKQLNISLREIFDATKVLERKQYGSALDVTINDAFGNIEKVVNEDKTIKHMLDESFELLRKHLSISHNDDETVKNVRDIISYAKDNEELMKNTFGKDSNATLEQIQMIKDFEDSKTLMKENVLSDENLSNNYELMNTIDNNSKKMKKEEFEIKDKDEYLIKLKKDRNSDIKEVLDDAVKTERVDIIEMIRESKMDALKRIDSINKVLNMTDNNSNALQTAIYINDELTNVNIYFDDDVDVNAKENGMIISLDLQNAGPIKADVRINNETKNVSINYLTLNEDAANLIVDSLNEIVSIMDDDYKVTEININGKNSKRISEKNNLYIKNNKLSKLLKNE